MKRKRRKQFNKLNFKTPLIPIISNVNVLPENNPDKLRKNLSEYKFTNASNIIWQLRMIKSNNEIGKITSGCFSPNLNKSIAIGYIQSGYNTDNPIFCEIRKKLELVKITNLPFVKKNYKKNGSTNE